MSYSIKIFGGLLEAKRFLVEEINDVRIIKGLTYKQFDAAVQSQHSQSHEIRSKIRAGSQMGNSVAAAVCTALPPLQDLLADPMLLTQEYIQTLQRMGIDSFDGKTDLSCTFPKTWKAIANFVSSPEEKDAALADFKKAMDESVQAMVARGEKVRNPIHITNWGENPEKYIEDMTHNLECLFKGDTANVRPMPSNDPSIIPPEESARIHVFSSIMMEVDAELV